MKRMLLLICAIVVSASCSSLYTRQNGSTYCDLIVEQPRQIQYCYFDNIRLTPTGKYAQSISPTYKKQFNDYAIEKQSDSTATVKFYTKMLIEVNGTVYFSDDSKNRLRGLTEDDIEDFLYLAPQQAKKAYGRRGRYGAITITTK